MPSIEAPTWYERSKGDAAQTSDQTSFFKQITDPLASDDTGDIESPLGKVYLVEVFWSDLSDYLPSSSSSADIQALGIEPGWYVVRLDDNGLCWAMTYGTDTFGEEQARADFAEAEAVSEKWDEADDGIY